MPRPFLPNSTQIPNIILDYCMAELSGAEFKVLMYIARRTYGFGKSSDRISLSQISSGIRRRDGSVLDRGTGLSRATVIRAISELVDRGLLLKDHDWKAGTSSPSESSFTLNLCSEEPESKIGLPSVQSKDLPTSETQELVEELVEQGLNRFDAIRLSDSNPDECRRQLNYLPFVKSFKSSKGAFLRTAIEKSFGPPPGFDPKGSAGQPSAKGTISSQQKTQIDYSALWREIESVGGQIKTAFCRYLQEKREIVVRSRLAIHSRSMQERLIECMNSEDYVLSQLEEWINTKEGKSLFLEQVRHQKENKSVRN